jgi:hypothetical protein
VLVGDPVVTGANGAPADTWTYNNSTQQLLLNASESINGTCLEAKPDKSVEATVSFVVRLTGAVDCSSLIIELCEAGAAQTFSLVKVSVDKHTYYQVVHDGNCATIKVCAACDMLCTTPAEAFMAGAVLRGTHLVGRNPYVGWRTWIRRPHCFASMHPKQHQPNLGVWSLRPYVC